MELSLREKLQSLLNLSRQKHVALNGFIQNHACALKVELICQTDVLPAALVT